jgi:hypothetical protein
MENNKPSKLETSLSELVAAAGKLAFEYSENGQEAYHLARVALVEFIKKSAHPVDSDSDFASLPSPSDRLH